MPAAKKTNKADAPAAAPVILYAEDNYLLSQVVRDVLELAGWRVKHCASGSHAAAHLRLEEHFDLAIIDRDLPGTDGLEVIRDARAHKHRQRTPMLLLALEDCAEEARASGADAFLRKPNDLLSLVETVRRLLGSRDVR